MRRERSPRRALSAALLLTLTLTAGGCAAGRHEIAYADTQRISANWPKFINYQNQLYSDLQAIENGKGSEQQKAAQMAHVQSLYRHYQAELTAEVRHAAAMIAQHDRYTLIVTREGRAYGGDDVTKQVEAILKITERTALHP